ncbi:MAG: DUF2784 domain-containing protein [Gemmatimonadota bacterium]
MVWQRFAADALVVVHLAFVGFVLLGALLVARWPRWAWVHLPSAAWGVWIELSGGVCPLTPLENRLRRAAGGGGYEGGFVEHYLLPVLYPSGLTPDVQTVLGLLVLLLNATLYAWVLWRHRASRSAV